MWLLEGKVNHYSKAGAECLISGRLMNRVYYLNRNEGPSQLTLLRQTLGIRHLHSASYAECNVTLQREIVTYLIKAINLKMIFLYKLWKKPAGILL